VNDPTTVSVIICAYTDERLKDIHEAVESVLAQTHKPHQVIVAVDNNESLYDVLKAELPLHVDVVLSKGTRGLSETRNAGIGAASGQIVAFIDDDAVADSTWLERLAKAFHNPGVAAAGGHVSPLWVNGERPVWLPEELDWVVGCTYRGLPTRGNAVRNMIGCNMTFRKAVLDDVGAFRSEVGRVGRLQGVGEEAELCLRISNSMPEATIIYEPAAVVYHKVPAWRLTPGYLARRSYNEGYYKRIVNRLSAQSSSVTLSTEGSYLRYLLLKAIPGRLARFYSPRALAQAGAIALSIVAVGLGYLKAQAA
jgi:glycosyltransferase involved in cell wall biosynthesis